VAGFDVVGEVVAYEQVVVLEGVFAVGAEVGLFFVGVEFVVAVEEYALSQFFEEGAMSVSGPDFFCESCCVEVSAYGEGFSCDCFFCFLEYLVNVWEYSSPAYWSVDAYGKGFLVLFEFQPCGCYAPQVFAFQREILGRYMAGVDSGSPVLMDFSEQHVFSIAQFYWVGFLK